MRLLLISILSFWAFGAFAIPCDCEVLVFSPITGSHKFPPTNLKTYELEEFARPTLKSQRTCRQLCLEKFEADMPSDRLTALLLNHSARLVEARAVGHNCTGLTTLKYPVRVKARLGNRSLGNVVDLIQVVNHEEICF